MNLLHKYILKETAGTFFFGLCIFTFIFLADQIFNMVDLIITKGVEPYKVLLLLLYIMPSFIAITMPMAVLLSTLLSFGRIMSDNELIAIKSSGIYLKEFIRPVILASLFISLALVVFNDQILPRANYAFKNLSFEIVRKRASVIIKEHQFIEEFNGYIFYAEQQDKITSTLNNILVYSLSTKDEPLRIITAKYGRVIPDNYSKKIFLKLFKGVIHILNQKAEGKYEQIFFNSYDIDLDINRVLSSGAFSINKSEREMGITELISYIKKNKDYISQSDKTTYVELHKKISIPFASFAFALIGIPLGMMVRRGGKTVEFGISLLLIFVYYLLLVLGETLGSKNILHPALSMWIPNIFISAVGFILIQRSKY